MNLRVSHFSFILFSRMWREIELYKNIKPNLIKSSAYQPSIIISVVEIAVTPRLINSALTGFLEEIKFSEIPPHASSLLPWSTGSEEPLKLRLSLFSLQGTAKYCLLV